MSASTAEPSSEKEALTAPFQVGDWEADPAACTLSRKDETASLEPKVMDLLALLASAPARVFTREELDDALWPDVTVGEDTLARTVSKLRRAFSDSPAEPRYIKTIPKRGYRLIAPVTAVEIDSGPAFRSSAGFSGFQAIGAIAAFIALSAGVLFFTQRDQAPPLSPAKEMTARADDLYMRFSRADNEAAISLYERAIAADPGYAPAQAGLANALVQRVVRWQTRPGEAPSATTLGDALSAGLNETKQAQDLLVRAADLAERAARLSPGDADALKALGFTYSAQGDVDRARKIYQQAAKKDPDAWEVMINLGELFSIAGDDQKAVLWYERAYAAMDRLYKEEPQRIGSWRAPLGVLLGEAYESFGKPGEAEIWYRRVLDQAPLEPEATIRLARLLRRSGSPDEAERLCMALQARIGDFADCADTASEEGEG